MESLGSLTIGEVIDHVQGYVMSLTLGQVLILVVVIYITIPWAMLGFGRPTIPRLEGSIDGTFMIQYHHSFITHTEDREKISILSNTHNITENDRGDAT